MLAQLVTAGVTLPLYYVAHMQTMPIADAIFPSDALERAQTLLPAIVLGYLLPSAALFLTPPQGVSLDTRQILAAIWQPFPIYIAVLHTSFRYMCVIARPNKASADAEAERNRGARALTWVKGAYMFSAAISAVSHWAILIPSLFSSDPPWSFAHVFVPYILHDYLPLKAAPLLLPAYRPTIRLLFQHDWLFMTVAAFVFFAWHKNAVSRGTTKQFSARLWLLRLVIVTVVGGPGASFALEAIEREEELWESRTVKGHTEADKTEKMKLESL